MTTVKLDVAEAEIPWLLFSQTLDFRATETSYNCLHWLGNKISESIGKLFSGTLLSNCPRWRTSILKCGHCSKTEKRHFYSHCQVVIHTQMKWLHLHFHFRPNNSSTGTLPTSVTNIQQSQKSHHFGFWNIPWHSFLLLMRLKRCTLIQIQRAVIIDELFWGIQQSPLEISVLKLQTEQKLKSDCE